MTGVIAGIDTHANTHQVALVNPDGPHLDCRQFPTGLDGLTQARD